MKRRYLYALLYSVPALMLAAVLTAVLVGATWGVLWLFVFGDDPWPPLVDRLAPVLMFAVLATAWGLLLSAAYRWGKRQEVHADLNKKHVYLAAGSAAALVLLVTLHQLSVGNIGPQPDVVACSGFCTAQQFGSSSFPRDGTCRCYGADGREALNVPMKDVRARQP
jgi:hypothetical protein